MRTPEKKENDFLNYLFDKDYFTPVVKGARAAGTKKNKQKEIIQFIYDLEDGSKYYVDYADVVAAITTFKEIDWEHYCEIRSFVGHELLQELHIKILDYLLENNTIFKVTHDTVSVQYRKNLYEKSKITRHFNKR
ncbi:hypothetical protein [Pseudomonas lactis]|uniref:hypothetical protein n=1 Tax=Pseudomonas lactis TaxID=1615674 RepID=UPI003F7CFA81